MLNIIDESDFNVDDGMYLVKVEAEWCGPCKRMKPTIQTLESEFSEIKFISIDVDQTPELAQKFKIKTVPTLLLLKDNVEIKRIVGLSLIDPLRKILREATTETNPVI